MSDLAWVEPPVSGEKWDPRAVRYLSFGSLPVVIDWLLIQTLIDTGLNRVAPGSHSSVYYRLDLISELDPAYFDIYQIAGNLLTVIDHDGEGAKALLLKGNAFLRDELPHEKEGLIRSDYWQHAWQIPVLLAYTELFHFDNIVRASEAFQEAAAIADSPEYLRRLDRRLKQLGGEYEVGIKLLGFMIEAAKTNEARDILEKKRKDLFVAQYVFDLNQSFIQYLKLQRFYNESRNISNMQMQMYFKNFMRKSQWSFVDPWGGQVHVDESGRIVTSTPYQPVFGLR